MIDSRHKPTQINLPDNLFWDIDPATLDPETHAQYIIERVLMRGRLEDWFEIKRFYGPERIKQAALKARYLDKRTLSFCQHYFNIPKEQFRCSTTPPSIRQLWDF